MVTQPRWFTETPEGNSHRYVQRFRELAQGGADLDGEARLIDAMVGRGARILDAGCGSGRTAAALFGRGHFVLGVDVDPVLVAAAEQDHPGPQWLVADLAGLDLRSRGYADSFDMIVCAGNVMSYVAAGTEIAVLSGFREHLAPQGRAVIGFQGDRYAVGDFDGHVAAAGLVLEQRFATWDLRPWHREAEFVVSVIAPA